MTKHNYMKICSLSTCINIPSSFKYELAQRMPPSTYLSTNLEGTRGNPVMTSTRREEMGQVDACRRGSGSSPMWTSTQKIKIRVHFRSGRSLY